MLGVCLGADFFYGCLFSFSLSGGELIYKFPLSSIIPDSDSSKRKGSDGAPNYSIECLSFIIPLSSSLFQHPFTSNVNEIYINTNGNCGPLRLPSFQQSCPCRFGKMSCFLVSSHRNARMSLTSDTHWISFATLLAGRMWDHVSSWLVCLPSVPWMQTS